MTAAALRRLLPFLFVAAAAPATAADPSPPVTTVDIAATASRQVPNDLGRVSVFSEQTGASLADISSAVNERVNAGLRTARGLNGAKVKTLSTYSRPIYGKTGKIESWAVRSEFMVESRDLAGLSQLIGKLQGSLGVSQLQLTASDETRRKVEDETTVEAIEAFRARAKLVAGALGKSWQIRSLSINSGGYAVPMMTRAAPSMGRADAVAPDIEAGESTISVQINGQIELPR